MTDFGRLDGRCGLVDELSAEFATDPPGQPALARAAVGQDDGELGGNLEMLRDYLDAARRHVRDHAVARQRAGPELDFCNPPARTAFATASIRQHVDPSRYLENAPPGIPSVGFTEESLEYA